MEKLDMQTPNFTDENIEKLAGLFPNCVTESKDDSGKLKKVIDFDLLKQELSENIVDGPRERYQINWPGKKEALVSANTPINKTLRPSREESVDFDTTENLYIEGDNLEALKLLQESYLGKVKMIYIDPPYNTGKDFVYKDNYTRSEREEFEESGQKNAEGGRLVANLESNGRYHSDWLSMMYSRIKLSRNLLQDDGIILLSIDDNEVQNLKKMCDEVFGEENFIAQIMPIANPGGRDYNQIAVTHEYLLVFMKTDKAILNEISKDVDFKLSDDKGGYELRELRNRNPRFHSGNRPNLFYAFYVNPDSKDVDNQCSVGLVQTDTHYIEVKPYNSTGKESVWRWGKSKASENILDNNILKSQVVARQKKDGGWNIYEKNRRSTTKVKSIWDETEMRTENGTRLLRSLFEETIFDHPKSISLLKRNVEIASNSDDIILDFFSGSGTTAHAVMQQNAEDGGKRKFIMVQLPEETDENSEAFKAGYKTIPEIGQERIRRAGKKIKEENADKEGIEDLDIGFRVLKIDSSNMKDVYYAPDQMSQSLLDSQEQNIKEDRTAEDLLFQVLLDWGVDLTLPIKREEIHGKTVYFVDEDTLVACFDDGLDAEFAKEIAARKPLRAVFKENGYKQDEDKINIDQVILQFSPDTEVRAI